MLTTLKTIALSLGLACAGSGAFAATIANLSFDGSAEVALAPQGAVVADGNYSASIDPTFDLTETNDFLLEADFSIDGISLFDDELLVEDVTGEELLFGALLFLLSADPAVLDVLESVFDEVSDADGVQSNIFDNVFLSFDLDEDNGTGSSSEGTFEAILSDGVFDEADFELASFLGGTFDTDFAGNFSISTVDLTPVPLPASLPMLAFGAFGLFAMKRRRQVR